MDVGSESPVVLASDSGVETAAIKDIDMQRPSVFTRLTPPSKSFAAVVGEKTSKGLEFFPLADRRSNLVTIPVELARQAAKAYNTTVVGYFLGPRIPFPIVQRSLRAAWGKFGFTDVMMNNNGFFFMKFNDEGGSIQAIEEGMIMIRDVPMFVGPWDPSKGLSRPSHDACPMWVKFHNIPLVLFNQEGISRIASALGVPKRMDACTSSMCDNRWGRPGFARVLIDVWATGELKKELEVVIPHLNDGGCDKIKIGVEYVWEPNQCSHCCVFGHKLSSCAKAVQVIPKKSQPDADGFVRVERKQWRRKESTNTSSLGTTSVDKEASTSGTKDDEIAGVADETIVANAVHLESPIGQSPIEPSEAGDTILPTDMVDPVVVVSSPVLTENPVESAHVRSSTVLESDGNSNVLETDGGGKGTTRLGMPPILPRTGGLPTDQTVPPKVAKQPIKGILKNPSNRFSVLNTNEEQSKERGLSREEGSLAWEELEGGNLLLMLNIGTWNIRGLNALDKQAEVKAFLSNNGIQLCAILETHLRDVVLASTCDRLFARWGWWTNYSFSDGGTRIVLAWDVALMDVIVHETHAQFINCEIRIKGSGKILFVSFVYGANLAVERKQLWSGLRKFKVLMGNKPWIITGDFNATLFPHDSFGGSSRRSAEMMDFSYCVEDVDVLDVRFSGVLYTWCQKPKEELGLRRKLDRVLANLEFTSMFDNATVKFLPRGLSDHSPSVLSFDGGVRKKKYGFKFDNFLVTDPQFLNIVKQHWEVEISGTFMFQVTSKLKALKKPLRQLRGQYGNLSTRANKLKHELDVVQLAADFAPTDIAIREDLQFLRVAYQQACWMDINAARQRAKVRWLSEADMNTRYFHQAVKEKRHTQHIHSVCMMNGEYVYGDDVANAFIDHFRSIIGSKDNSVVATMHPELFTNKLSVPDSNHMVRPILDEEIKHAMFHIGNYKAPGSDGYSAKFFKATWDIVGPDVLRAIHNFFYRGHLSKELNHTLLCLLPKKPNATVVSDFRPIACCSVLYKCISKVIVDRLKPALDGLINKAQSAFIPGRKITDNILMAHELVNGYHLRKGPPRCAFKIDLRKAYDMISWDFLLCMLHGLGIHPVLIQWIRELISSPSFSIVLNGESWGNFKGERGIRQGDPLSPYLFTVVMEGFTMLFRHCINEAVSFGYHHGCHDFQISHLCFADDLFVFTRGDTHSVEVLKKALDLFAKCSGLSPNLDKSDVFFGNVPDDEKHAILQCLPFRLGSFPIRYLGIPLSPVALKPADYSGIIARVKERLHNWKSKFLSYGGRRQLVVSVLQSLQLYWMQIFMFPAVVVHDIEKCLRDFLWAQGDSSRGKCKVAWSLVCRPRNCGGLGFKRLTVWNRALLAKNLWSILSNRDCLWVRWIKHFSLKDGVFWMVKRNNRWSWVLAKMMTMRIDIRRFVSYTLGDGRIPNAWEDAWLPCGHLAAFIPYRMIHAASFTTTTTVHELLSVFTTGWPNDWSTRFPILANTPLPNLVAGTHDVISWDATSSGDRNFSVHRAYNSFMGPVQVLQWTKGVWFKGHIPKHSFCLWLACLQRHPTQDRILEWKHDPPDMKCSLCNMCMDSHDHLFFRCTVANQVWLKVLDNLHWNNFPDTWDAIFHCLSDTDLAPKSLRHRLALAAAVYTIWCERNRRLFTGVEQPVPHLVASILSIVEERVAWQQRKRRITSHHVLAP
ncbi:LOW QUALITY PROTEIN: hypothetical protein OSB04_un000277 [Centaurea solstitialis]|uniref:Reverse transcriptase domain-containing protein n=1 Tax=Centaurea solstitialis TaxID=347529 RepID=A0AA38W2S0_9ASTR|nr:LOW QUALITY PROTEIN: hypothetical protein OSB04_un000277 [Centaurea solstitialis]